MIDKHTYINNSITPNTQLQDKNCSTYKLKQKVIKIRSQGEDIEISNMKIFEIANNLGIYLKNKYWYSLPKSDGYIMKEIYENKKSIGMMMAHLRECHFRFRNIFCFCRSFIYEKYGNRFDPAQKIICFDIDGHKGEDTQKATKYLCTMFPEVKYIEYSHNSNSYHVYVEFDRAVFDYALNNLRKYFEDRSYNIDPITSSEHMRFPFSMNYNCYGLYDPNEELLVHRMDIDTLLCFWNKIYNPGYFDPQFEMVKDIEIHGEKIKQRKGTSSRKKIIEDLIEDKTYDYGKGERHIACTRILAKVVYYHLTEADFENICTAHDKGARGKTDYQRYYEWGMKKWGSQSIIIKSTDFSRIIEGVLHYAGDTILPDKIKESLNREMDQSLVSFLATRANLCKNSRFNNASLIRKRYGAQVQEFLLFLYRYQIAKEHEIHLIHGNQLGLLLPLVFRHTEKGIPLPLTFIKVLGTHFHSRALPEVKVYLERIGWLIPIQLNDRGDTYAEGRCIYYSLSFDFIEND